MAKHAKSVVMISNYRLTASYLLPATSARSRFVDLATSMNVEKETKLVLSAKPVTNGLKVVHASKETTKRTMMMILILIMMG